MSAQNEAELQRLLDEQKELQALIDEQRAWWREVRELGIPKFWEMASRLATLRHRLAEHFSHEESAEHQAVKAALHMARPDQVAAMAEDHSDLLRRLDAMVAKANECIGYECWGEIGLEFSELIHAIDEHERAEFRMLAETLGERSMTASI